VFYALQNTNALFSDTKFDPSVEVASSDIPALRRHTGFPFLAYGFRNRKGKSIVAYWLAAHSSPGNVFPPLYATMSLKNTGIAHPVLVDIVSGEIKPIRWKMGTTDTIEELPVRDSIMAITDESYFDWPVLPEAPRSLEAAQSGRSVRLTWEVHGGNPTGVVVERATGGGSNSPGHWEKIASLGASATGYRDSALRNGNEVAYRVRAVNGSGESAYSNVVRVRLP